MISDTIPASIALLRLDTDWYSSTKHEIEHLYPKLSPQGILILDDYGHFLLQRIDYSCRLAIKPTA
jgi:hypothetical protein